MLADAQQRDTVRVLSEDATVLTLSREDVQQIIGPDSRARMLQIVRVGLLKECPLFASTPREEIVKVAKLLRREEWPAGALIVSQGTTAGPDVANRPCMYLIESGSCRAVRREPTSEARQLEERSVAHLPKVHPSRQREGQVLFAGETFGKMRLLYSSPQSSTVTAEEPTVTLSLDWVELESALGPRGARLIDEAAIEHILWRLEPLARMSVEEAASVLRKLERKRYKRWEPILTKGDPLSGLVVLKRGAMLEVAGPINEAASDEVITHATPGTWMCADCAGFEGPCPCSFVSMADDTEILFIPRDVLREVHAGHLASKEGRQESAERRAHRYCLSYP